MDHLEPAHVHPSLAQPGYIHILHTVRMRDFMRAWRPFRIRVDMELHLCIVATLFVAGSAIISQPHSCRYPQLCAPRVITNCPRKDPISECATCCCKSSENLEFYNPAQPEPWCSAPPAVYTVTFVGTWTGVCHPDYYFSNAHWSPPTGASHNIEYQMWDACMDNVSPGVAQVSQTGSTRLIRGEYAAAGDNIPDTFVSGGISGGGVTSSDLRVDKYHQWVSTVTMLAPSRDRMVGVADLRLCNGYDWKRSLKVCSELFSTATMSERVHPSMQRNSIQWNNCSFGYFEFTFKEYESTTQEPSSDCEHDGRDVCPPVDDQPYNCRTCCCKSSENVDFFHPGAANQTVCGATESAKYKVSLVPTMNQICHPNYPGGVDSLYFSDLLVTSHHPFQLLDTCGGVARGSNVFDYLVRTEEVLTFIIDHLRERVIEGDIGDFYLSPDTLERGRRKRRVAIIEVLPRISYVTLISKLLPSGEDNRWVGFSGLNMCGPDGWKDRVKVCLPLLALFNRTLFPENETQLQGNYCSFAHALLERIDVRNAVSSRADCRPHDESVFKELSPSACCYCEFIIEGQIIRITERYGDARYSHTLTVRVTAVHYDEIDHIDVDDVVTIKVCSLPFRIRFKRTYRLAGSIECGSNELEISENGVVASIPELGSGGLVGEGQCTPYIHAGNCDDQR